MLFNLAKTLHSSAKWKNKQVAKIWGFYLKKQRFGDTMYFPEGLEDIPFIENIIESTLKSTDKRTDVWSRPYSNIEHFFKYWWDYEF